MMSMYSTQIKNKIMQRPETLPGSTCKNEQKSANLEGVILPQALGKHQ